MPILRPPRFRRLSRLLAAIVTPILFGNSRSLPAAQPVGIVSHVKVLSDKVEDVSSLDAWKKSFVKEGMDEKQKALAVWQTVVKFRQQEIPPNEFLDGEEHVHDPIKAFNVYGYGQCCCASAAVEALARYAGLEARGWGITGHSVPEIKIAGNWSMFDGSLVNYFQKSDGTIAGVEEISKSIADWNAQHADLKGNRNKLYKYMTNGGWRSGPPVLACSVSYDKNGWLPAATHAWGDSMTEFGSGPKNFIYEYGSAIGYEVNIQLRPGEKLTRNWANKGLHVNMLEGKDCSTLRESPQNHGGQLRYAPKFGDLTNGRIGNGALEYDVPLASGAFRGGMLSAENIASTSEDHAAPAVHVKDPAQPGVLLFRMPSSYVYLGGELNFTPVIGDGGAIAVSFSDNNGLDWKEIASITTSTPQHVDLTPLTYRRYDYRLMFTLRGKGTGLSALHVTHDIQHSQRPLPILDAGDNHISFSAGGQEGTITVEGNLDPNDAAAKGKNLLFSDFHPQLENVSPQLLRLKAGAGTVTIPIQTPGDIVRLRVGGHYRARDAKDGWSIDASFDGGKTFLPIGTLDGPTTGFSKYIVFDKPPTGARSVVVRLAGRQRNTTCMLGLRIDADYAEPHGGFAPVKVTYAYDENGQAKTDVHVARSAQETYTIHCDAKPALKSITLELAE